MRTSELTFKIGEATFTRTTNGYYYTKSAETDGKWKRIKQAEFDEVHAEYVAATTIEEETSEEAIENYARELKEAVESQKSTKTTPKATKAQGKAKKTARKAYWEAEIDEQRVTLTEKQVTFLKEMPNDDFFENGLESALWIDVYCDTVSGLFNPMAVGAMISTLREKELIYVMQDRINGRKCKYFGFTNLGKEVAFRLGLDK